ncbi:MAG TPA: FtsX-like permease family protein, partial [Bryobacteraceae bacterium]|nr:FtsX-like permease family protein [Bryobacteraceae bacterium]
FQGENPVGKSFDIPQQNGPPRRYQIVGMVKDARYDNVRTPIPPVAYVPYTAMDQDGQMMPKGRAAFMVRTVNPDPAQMMSALRREVSRARPEFRVTNARTQEEIDNAHTIRERLLAMLALFFSATALLLAGVGLYGVLDYSVLQRRREIGIRMALGANWANVVRRVTWDVFALVVLGAALGVAAGLSAERYIRTLLFGVTSADLTLLSVPLLSIAGVAMLAALPAVIRAVRIDPAKLLRAD